MKPYKYPKPKDLEYPDDEDFGYYYVDTRQYAPKKCQCGAKFTSFPNKHYDWCDLYDEKKE